MSGSSEIWDNKSGKHQISVPEDTEVVMNRGRITWIEKLVAENASRFLSKPI